jgi:hypothetical protein
MSKKIKIHKVKFDLLLIKTIFITYKTLNNE